MLLVLYKDWLIQKIEFDGKSDMYIGLLDLLYETPFRWVIKSDKNRAADGIDWRWMFCQECDYDLNELNELIGDDCTVLEMLVGLAFKVANDVVGDIYKGDRTPDWFWRFIKNLGLDGCYGDYLPVEFRVHAMAKLNKWMNRDIGYDGSGGLFPLKNPPGDERKVEIMYQMYAYVHENFPV